MDNFFSCLDSRAKLATGRTSEASHPIPSKHIASTSANLYNTGNTTPLNNSTYKISNTPPHLHDNNTHTSSVHQDARDTTPTTLPRDNTSIHSHSSTHRRSSPPPSTAGVGTSSSPNDPKQKEVDYYLNPTELFRWINYRRWDGAKTRVQMNPEECSIWVVSRHATDGRILWKNLPLHLVSMQTGLPPISYNDNENLDDETKKQLEKQVKSQDQLVDLTHELIRVYPEATSLPDDQGMLPLHLCLNAVNSHTLPNDRVLYMLMVSNPLAFDVVDSQGRTPIDILNSKDSSEGKRRALDILKSGQRMLRSIQSFCQQDKLHAIQKVEEEAKNEREASQQILKRLERELSEDKKTIQGMYTSADDAREQCKTLNEELNMMNRKIANYELDVDQVRKERDELVVNNEQLRAEMDKHDGILAEMKRQSNKEREEQHRRVATMKSEANTARAMAEALEEQLRCKFSNEEELKNKYSEMEENMAKAELQYKEETTKMRIEIERLEHSNLSLKKSLENAGKKNVSVQKRLDTCERYLSEVLTSYSDINAEYNRSVESSSRYHTAMLKEVKEERNNLSALLEKQRKTFEEVCAEQEQALQEATRKEVELRNALEDEKRIEKETIGKIRSTFQGIRTKLSSQNLNVNSPKPVVQKKRDSEKKVQSKPQNIPEQRKVSIDERNNDLLGFLEERAQNPRYSNRKQQPAVSTTSSSSSSSSVGSGSTKKGTPSPRLHFYSPKNDEGIVDSKTNDFQSEDDVSSSHQPAVKTQSYNDTFNTGYSSSQAQKTFTLDEFSESYDTRNSMMTDTTLTNGSYKDMYPGMKAGWKSGMVRLGSQSPSEDSMASLRRRFDLEKNKYSMSIESSSSTSPGGSDE